MKNKLSIMFRYCQFCKNGKRLKSSIYTLNVGGANKIKKYHCKFCNCCVSRAFSKKDNRIGIIINVDYNNKIGSNTFFCYFYQQNHGSYQFNMYDSYSKNITFPNKKNAAIEIFEYAIRYTKNRNLM